MGGNGWRIYIKQTGKSPIPITPIPNKKNTGEPVSFRTIYFKSGCFLQLPKLTHDLLPNNVSIHVNNLFWI